MSSTTAVSRSDELITLLNLTLRSSIIVCLLANGFELSSHIFSSNIVQFVCFILLINNTHFGWFPCQMSDFWYVDEEALTFCRMMQHQILVFSFFLFYIKGTGCHLSFFISDYSSLNSCFICEILITCLAV
jgi:hypothetical protein